MKFHSLKTSKIKSHVEVVRNIRTVAEDNNNYNFIFEDEGIPFNPLEKENPDISLSASKREVGGLGIFLTKEIMDDIKYKYENNKNILTILKKI